MRLFDLAEEMDRVHYRHDGVELGPCPYLLVDEEGLRDGSRIGETRRLDDDAVEPARPLHQAAEDTDQVAANVAADAPVVHLEDLFLGVDHQIVVDARLAELVDDHGVALAVGLREDAVEEGRLSGTKVAGEDRDGDLRLRCGGGGLGG